MAKKILFSLIPLLVLHLALEGIARLLPPVPFTGGAAGFMGDTEGLFVEDPLLMWRVRQNLETERYRTGPRGFRGGALPARRAPGDVFRIVILGDSTSWGWGVPEGTPYPQVLEKLLSSGETPVDVQMINGGTPGYTSHQGELLFRTELAHYEPDFVVTYFGVNDSSSRPGMTPDHERRLPPLWLTGAMRLLRRSMLYTDARRAALLLRKNDGVRNSGGTGASPSPRPRVSPAQFRDNLAAIEHTAAEYGAPVLHVTPAWNFAGHIRNDVKLVVFSDEGVVVEYTGGSPAYSASPTVDLATVLRGEGLSATEAFVDYCHLSPAGHGALARRLAGQIAARIPSGD